MVAFALEQEHEHLAHDGLVLDDEDGSSVTCSRLHLGRIEHGTSGWRFLTDRRLNRKHRSFARAGPDVDGMPQQIGKTLYDRETEADALAALASRVVELMEFLEDRRKLIRRNADTGVPHLDAQRVAAAPAPDQPLP